MTATWALVFMICTGRGGCTVDYVENYNTRVECVKRIPKDTSFIYQSHRAICAPISKD
jgi:hypothetical protein